MGVSRDKDEVGDNEILVSFIVSITNAVSRKNIVANNIAAILIFIQGSR